MTVTRLDIYGPMAPSFWKLEASGFSLDNSLSTSPKER